MFIKSNLLFLWERIRSSFWFLPALMSGGAVLILFLSFAYGERLTELALFDGFSWLDIRDKNAASQLLTTVIGSTINVVGIVFSLTVVALTIVASQYGSQVLRNFMEDNSTKFTLGTFIANFIYSLLCLRLLASLDEEAGVPQLPMALALVFTVFSVGVLIFFIHHIAKRIQVANIVKRLSIDLLSAAGHLYPESWEEGADEPRVLPLPPHPGAGGRLALRAQGGGYVESVAVQELAEYGCEHDCLVEVLLRPGDFAVRGAVLGYVYGERHLDEEETRALCEAFVVGSQRTPTQDIKYNIEKLAEVGVRALSPGINEPYVAIKCIDYLSLFLAFLAGRRVPSPWHCDREGEPRVWMPALSFAEAVDESFNQLAHFSGNNSDVMLRLLEALRRVHLENRDPGKRGTLEAYARKLADIIHARQWEAGAAAPLLELCSGMGSPPRG